MSTVNCSAAARMNFPGHLDRSTAAAEDLEKQLPRLRVAPVRGGNGLQQLQT